MTQEIAIPLWRDGRNGNVQFLSSFKRLEKENPDLYKLIEQKEGFECQDFEYSYKVGVSKFGLWLSRRKMGGGQDSRPAIAAAGSRNNPYSNHSKESVRYR